VLDATAPERRLLTADIDLVADALDRTRPHRVLDLARQPSRWHVELFGPVPNSPAGHAVWCHAAHQLETHLDFRDRGGPEWDRFRRDLADTSDLCAVAHHYLDLDRPATHPDRWAHVAETAQQLRLEFTVRQHQPEHPGLERSIGVGLGL
jgi:hypothetical protein